MAMNYLAILVATIANYVLGALWYGPLFGKIWIKEMGWNEKKLKEMQTPQMKRKIMRSYIGMFITSLIMVGVLAYILSLIGSATILQTMTVASLIWLGFLATTGLGSIFWESKSLRLYTLNAGYQLVGLLIIAAILGAWQ